VVLAGALPNITRNAIVNAAELVSYDIIKETLVIRRRLMSDNWPCHFVSAFGAGFCATCVASPVDVVKTRYMNSSAGVYRGALHCAASMVRERGLFTFYKGYVTLVITENFPMETLVDMENLVGKLVVQAEGAEQVYSKINRRGTTHQSV